MAPPRARGSTPVGAAAMARTERLPRVRGDRPQAAFADRGAEGAPPRARGSTRGSERKSETHTGSPACAGIDPWCRGVCTARPRLPRVRGDRPDRAGVVVGLVAAPPRARGSTLKSRIGYRCVVGSPACAGIDPSVVASLGASLWLPRVRGDRPCAKKQDRLHRWAPLLRVTLLTQAASCN